MEKCRLCLKHSKKFESIFDNVNNEKLTYAAMINSLTNAKVSKCDGITDQICLACQRKTKEFWDFKLQVERAYIVLQENSSLKRVNFSNLKDIEFSVTISTDDLKKPMPADITKNLNQNGDEPFNYNETVIKRVPIDEKKPFMSVADLLSSMNEENDNDHWDDDHTGEEEIKHEAADPADESLVVRHTRNTKYVKQITSKKEETDWKLVQPLKDRLTRKKKLKPYRDDDPDYEYLKLQPSKKGQLKNNKMQRPYKLKEKFILLSNPIKPVFLEDYAVLPSYVKRKKKEKSDKRRICPYCGKLVLYLKSHIITHTSAKTYQCDKCTKKYYSSAALRKHVKETHGPKIFKCDHCVAVFASDRSLKHHSLVHSAQKDYVCNICNKSFKKSQHLYRHRGNTHNLGVKPIQCEICPDRFNTTFGLKHHMRVHTGERPYRCEMCSQPYSYKADFNRHCLKKHGIFLYRRSVNVMNEEVMMQERILVRDLLLRVNGVLKDGKPLNPFDGPNGAMAFELLMKAIQTGRVVVDLQL